LKANDRSFLEEIRSYPNCWMCSLEDMYLGLFRFDDIDTAEKDLSNARDMRPSLRERLPTNLPYLCFSNCQDRFMHLEFQCGLVLSVSWFDSKLKS
jgi:hypothetical protein